MNAKSKAKKNPNAVGINLIPLMQKEKRIWTKDGITIIERHQLQTLIRRRGNSKYALKSSVKSRASSYNKSLSHISDIEEQLSKLVATLEKAEEKEECEIGAATEIPAVKSTLASPENNLNEIQSKNLTPLSGSGGFESENQPATDVTKTEEVTVTEPLDVSTVNDSTDVATVSLTLSCSTDAKKWHSDNSTSETINNLSKSVANPTPLEQCLKSIKSSSELPNNNIIPLAASPCLVSPDSIEDLYKKSVSTSRRNSPARDNNPSEVEDTFIYNDCMSAQELTIRTPKVKHLLMPARSTSVPSNTHGSACRPGHVRLIRQPPMLSSKAEKDDHGEGISCDGAKENGTEGRKCVDTQNERPEGRLDKCFLGNMKNLPESAGERPGSRRGKDRIRDSYKIHVERQQRAHNDRVNTRECSSREIIRGRLLNSRRPSPSGAKQDARLPGGSKQNYSQATVKLPRGGKRDTSLVAVKLPRGGKRDASLTAMQSLNSLNEMENNGNKMRSPCRIRDSYKVFVERQIQARNLRPKPDNKDGKFIF